MMRPKKSNATPRFAHRNYLVAAYRQYVERKLQKRVRANVRRLIATKQLLVQAGAHPLKVLIEAMAAQVDAKTRSRWSRALTAADYERVPAGKLRSYLRKNGVVAGAARRIAEIAPKRVRRVLDSWAETTPSDRSTFRLILPSPANR